MREQDIRDRADIVVDYVSMGEKARQVTSTKEVRDAAVELVVSTILAIHRIADAQERIANAMETPLDLFRGP